MSNVAYGTGVSRGLCLTAGADMSWLDDDTSMLHWSFGSAHFACQISGSSWEGWFPATAIVDIKPVLDSNKRYIDVGGTVFGSLSRQCSFPDASTRDAFLNMIGQTATLTNGAGRSGSAVLTAAQYVNADGPYYLASATWESL